MALNTGNLKVKNLISTKAFHAYQERRFHDAIELYSSLGKIIGEVNVKTNISICLKRVKTSLPIYLPNCPYDELIRICGFSDASNLLYADIDLNTVDGSAIWMSSMATILASNKRTIVFSKNKIHRSTIVKNIYNRDNILILTPGNFSTEKESLNLEECIFFIKNLDHILPHLKTIVVRGLAAATALVRDRQFYKRLYVYLTDFYQHEGNDIVIKEKAFKSIDVLARQSQAFLVQTKKIESKLREITTYPFKSFYFPPPIPDGLLEISCVKYIKDSVINIGYAGKIAPNWGIQQLIEWIDIFRKEGFKIQLTVIGDKVSGAGSAANNKKFRTEIAQLMEKVGAHRLGALGRNQVIEVMSKMDYAWCWRPSYFEDKTLELSTKLIEGVIAGQACIAYPSITNVEALGKDYPLFARGIDDFREILIGGVRTPSTGLRKRLNNNHSISSLSQRFSEFLENSSKEKLRDLKISLAAHDPKFIFPYYSMCKYMGVYVNFDEWEWGNIINESQSSRYAADSDVIFCEWGLANSVWYSNNLPENKKLIIRVHLQEIGQKAARFGREINKQRVDLFIFVSDRVRQEAIKMFGFPEKKTCVIPNFVLNDEYRFIPRDFSGAIRLGMVGIVPQRKRFDRAVDLTRELLHRGEVVELKIKGPRPETIEWMKVGSRAKELDYYYGQYAAIESDPDLSRAITFDGWGNDVALFYEGIDHILSPSDFESFHYALADGVLSGCHPIVWPWDEASEIYSNHWIVSDVVQAADKIMAFRSKSSKLQLMELKDNRERVLFRYGFDTVSEKLDQAINKIAS